MEVLHRIGAQLTQLFLPVMATVAAILNPQLIVLAPVFGLPSQGTTLTYFPVQLFLQHFLNFTFFFTTSPAHLLEEEVLLSYHFLLALGFLVLIKSNLAFIGQKIMYNKQLAASSFLLRKDQGFGDSCCCTKIFTESAVKGTWFDCIVGIFKGGWFEK